MSSDGKTFAGSITSNNFSSRYSFASQGMDV